MENNDEVKQVDNISGTRLREVRKYFKYTQQEISEKVGVTQGIWARYEVGTATISKRVLMLLENNFEIDPKYITGESDNMFKKASNTSFQEILYKAMNVYHRLSPKNREIVDNYIDATLNVFINLMEQP